MDNQNILAGKAAVVIGATAGIGLAVATALAGQGALVIGVGRSQARCMKAKETILFSQPGAHILFLTADLF